MKSIFFTEEYAEYLTLNGYVRSEGRSALYFKKADMQVVIRHECIDVFVHHPEEPGERCAEWSFYKSYTGLSQLNRFSFFMLMHVLEVVPIQQFLRRARETGVQVREVADELMKYFRVDEIPAAY